MTEAIIKREDQSLAVIPSAQNLRMLAQDFINSGVFPMIKNVPEAITKIQAGHELGVPPIASLNTMTVINGRLTMDAKLLLAIAHRRADVSWKIIQETDDICEMEFSRPGFSPITVSFTAKEAQAAGLLTKANWKNYRRDMLFARCSSRGVRRIAPDAVLGLYSTEEMIDTVSTPANHTDRAEKMEPRAPEGPKTGIVEPVADDLSTPDDPIIDAEPVNPADTDLFGDPVEPGEEEAPPLKPLGPRPDYEPSKLAQNNIVKTQPRVTLHHEGERDGIVSAIKETLKAEKIDEKLFKQWLGIYQMASVPVRHYIGTMFGNPSLREGDLDDLHYLFAHMAPAIKKFKQSLKGDTK